jgi:hypothetical protein
MRVKTYFFRSCVLLPGIASRAFAVLQPFYFTFLRLDVHDETAAILLFCVQEYIYGGTFRLFSVKTSP